MGYITQSHTWVTDDTITADRLNGNVDDFVDGLSDGTKDLNINQATSDLAGNASTNTLLEDAQNINFIDSTTGAACGSVAFDGSQNVLASMGAPLYPVAEAILTFGFNNTCQTIMDTMAASLVSTSYELFTYHWEKIQYAATFDLWAVGGVSLQDAIDDYNTAFPLDQISAGNETTLLATKANEAITTESSNNLSNFAIGTWNSAAGIAGGKKYIKMDLDNSVTTNFLNPMVFANFFGPAGVTGNGAGGTELINDFMCPTYSIQVWPISTLASDLEIRIISDFSQMYRFSTPNKLHVLIYNLGD
jgi:hypothetical protein|tara:strand:+ start:4368 stop:5279 length:912 start_codon:yes stop_codon:yes gene_type:complete